MENGIKVPKNWHPFKRNRVKKDGVQHRNCLLLYYNMKPPQHNNETSAPCATFLPTKVLISDSSLFAGEAPVHKETKLIELILGLLLRILKTTD